MISPDRIPAWLRPHLHWVTALVFRLCMTAAVLGLGPRAVSDDDYHRAVLAQQFAEQPFFAQVAGAWLSLPFWIVGGMMQIFGRDLWVAYAVGVLQGLAGTWAFFTGCRWLGCSKRQALIASVLASLVPQLAVHGA